MTELFSREQLEKIAKHWSDIYNSGEVYGFGLSTYLNVASFIKNGTREYFKLKAIFDNNNEIQNQMVNGWHVLSTSKIKEIRPKIITFPSRYFPIKKQLEGMGLIEYEDFINYRAFLALYYYFVLNKVFLWEATSAVTTRCTLNCEECNMFMPQYRNPADLSLEELLGDMEILFDKVDYVFYYCILGGEPLWHKNINEYMAALAKYKDKIGMVVIATNGTIVMQNELINTLKKIPNLKFDINNYKVSEGYNKTFQKFLAQIKDHCFYHEVREYAWSKYRRDEPITDEGELIAHYKRCGQPFVAIQQKRLYSCHLPWSAMRSGISDNDPHDYLDLTDDKVSCLDIIRLGLGYLPRGYTSNCAMCNGCDMKYFIQIPKAEQKNERNLFNIKTT